MNAIEFGDCRETMRRWAVGEVKVQTCITSPPYFGLRAYMPDAIKLRNDLNLEECALVMRELERLGIKPCAHTSNGA